MTTVQSLYLLNDEFVHARAGQLAARLLQTSNDHDRRLLHAFELILGRPPTEAERRKCYALDVVDER